MEAKALPSVAKQIGIPTLEREEQSITLTENTLLLSLADIARVAHAQRPVVSRWRKRIGSGELPFPSLSMLYVGMTASMPVTWSSTLNRWYRPEIAFYEEVRVWMAKFDAVDRQARGEPIPEDISRLLAQVIATSTATGEVLDIYEAAGMPRPSLSDSPPNSPP